MFFFLSGRHLTEFTKALVLKGETIHNCVFCTTLQESDIITSLKSLIDVTDAPKCLRLINNCSNIGKLFESAEEVVFMCLSTSSQKLVQVST